MASEHRKLKQKEYKATYRKKHAEKLLAENTKYRKKNPEKTRAWHLKAKYGLTPEQWEVLFNAQGEKCRICLSPDHGGNNWHTDHCHETGKVRGILCHGCNAGLGHFKDNQAALARAIDYLGIS